MENETPASAGKKGEGFPPEIAAFGQALRLLRYERKLSQKKLAKAVGMNRSYLSDVERGLNSISLQYIVRVAKVFDMKLSDLFLMMEQHADEENGRRLLYELRMRRLNEEREDRILRAPPRPPR